MKPGRLSLATLWIAATCALLCACGGGQTHTASGAARASGGTTRAPDGVAHNALRTLGARGDSTPVSSRAQALAFARAVNLTVADIPEASVEKKRTSASNAEEKREYDACETSGDVGDSHKVAEASSPKLRRGQELEIERITSSVTILSDEHALARQFALLASPTLRKCGARALARNLDDRRLRNARWGHVTVSKLPVSAPGTSATAGLRIVADLDLPLSEVTIPFYVDVLGFSIGRAEVALTATSATQPVPAATERELLALLLERARAHPL
jgi:hypothetical protein